MSQGETFKGYLIDAENREVREVTLSSWNEMRVLVGGYLETAYVYSDDSVVYVDEGGLLKSQQHYFSLRDRPDQPLAGNGLLVGAERKHSDSNLDPVMTLDEFRKRVRFL